MAEANVKVEPSINTVMLNKYNLMHNITIYACDKTFADIPVEVEYTVRRKIPKKHYVYRGLLFTFKPDKLYSWEHKCTISAERIEKTTEGFYKSYSPYNGGAENYTLDGVLMSKYYRHVYDEKNPLFDYPEPKPEPQLKTLVTCSLLASARYCRVNRLKPTEQDLPKDFARFINLIIDTVRDKRTGIVYKKRKPWVKVPGGKQRRVVPKPIEYVYIPPKPTTVPRYWFFNVVDLKKIAKEVKLKGYSKLRKHELAVALYEYMTKHPEHLHIGWQNR